MSRRPLVLYAICAVAFGTMAFLAKLASARLSGSEVALLRFVAMLSPLLLVPAIARQARRFDRLDLLLIRGVCGGIAVLLFFLAIAHIPVGIATLLNYSSPIWSVLFAALFLGEPVDRRLIVPFLAAFAGMLLVVESRSRPGDLLGFGRWELVGFLSAILSGAAVAAIRAARRSESSWSIYASFSIFGFVTSAPFGVASWRTPNGREWLLLAGVGATSIAAQLLMTYSYRWVTNMEAGVLAQLAVVTAMLLGAIFLGDRLTWSGGVGALLAIGGVIGVAWIQSGGGRAGPSAAEGPGAPPPPAG